MKTTSSDAVEANETAMEVDARHGMLIRAINDYASVEAVAECAINALTTEITRLDLSEAVRCDLVVAFLASGGFASVWMALEEFVDRKEFVESALTLLAEVLACTKRAESMLPPRRDWMTCAVTLGRAIAIQSHDNVSILFLRVVELIISQTEGSSTSILQMDVVQPVVRALARRVDDPAVRQLLAAVRDAQERYETADPPEQWKLFTNILSQYEKLPVSSRQVIQILSRVSKEHFEEGSRSERTFIEACAQHSQDDTSDEISMACQYAPVLSQRINYSEDIQVSPDLIKELVRVLRARTEPSELVLRISQLFLHLLTQESSYRNKLVDNGAVQVVSKLLYIYHDQDDDVFYTLSNLVTRISQALDVRHNSSILQRLVQKWKQSLTPPSDMDSFVESLEMNCYVVAALCQVNDHGQAFIKNGCAVYYATLLRYNLQDRSEVSESTFQRVMECCLYALNTLVRLAGMEQADHILNTTELLGLAIASMTEMLSQGQQHYPTLRRACTFTRSLLVHDSGLVDYCIESKLHNAMVSLLVKCTEPATLRSVLQVSLSVISGGVRFKEALIKEGFLQMLCDRLLRDDIQQVNESCVDLVIIILEDLVRIPDSFPNELVTRWLLVLRSIYQASIFRLGAQHENRVRTCAYLVQVLVTREFIGSNFRRLGQITPKILASQELDDDEMKVLDVVEVVLMSDHEHGFLQLPERQLFLQIAERLLGLSTFVDTNSIVGVISAGSHLLADPDQVRCKQLALTIIHDVKANVLRLAWIKYVSSNEAYGDCFRALVDGIVVRSQHRGERGRILVDAICYLLQVTSDPKSSVSSTSVVALLGIINKVVQEWKSARQIVVDASILQLYSLIVSHLSDLLPNPSVSSVDPEEMSEYCLEDCVAHARALRDLRGNGDVAALCVLLEASSRLLRFCVERSADYGERILQDDRVRELIGLLLNGWSQTLDPSISWFSQFFVSLVVSHGIELGQKLLSSVMSPQWLLLQGQGEDEIDDELSRSGPGLSPPLSYTETLHTLRLASQDALNSLKTDSSSVVEPYLQTTLALLCDTLLSASRVAFNGDQDASRLTWDTAELVVSIRQRCPQYLHERFDAVAIALLRLAARAYRNSDPARCASSLKKVSCLVDASPTNSMLRIEYLNLLVMVGLRRLDRESVLESFDDICRHLRLLLCSLSNSDAGIQTAEMKASRLLSALGVKLVKRWKAIEVAQVTTLLDILVSSTRLFKCLCEAIIGEPPGVDYLLALCIEVHSSSIQEVIVMFLAEHEIAISQATTRCGEKELKMVLLVIDGDPNAENPSRLVTRRRSEIIAGLRVLKVMISVQKLAPLVNNLDGLAVLYDLLSCSTHDDLIFGLALDVCCAITQQEEAARVPHTLPMLKLLFLATEPRCHPDVFRSICVLLEQCTVLGSPSFSWTLAQLARTYLVKWTKKHSIGLPIEGEESIIARLYQIQNDENQEKLKTDEAISDPEGCIPRDLVRQVTAEQLAIKSVILKYYQIVRCEMNDSMEVYVDVQTSAKTIGDVPREYVELQQAMYRLRWMLKDPLICLNNVFCQEILPAICEIIILHSTTSDIVCIAVESLSRIAFVRPGHVIASKAIDLTALFAASMLHASRSLPFAIFAAALCENIALDACDSDISTTVNIVEFLVSLLLYHEEDVDIVSSCTFALSVLLPVVPSECLFEVHSNPLSLLTRALRNHAHDITITWYCLDCLRCVLAGMQSLEESVLDSIITSLVSIVKANVGHPFLVRSALETVELTHQKIKALTRRTLLETDVVDLLVRSLDTHQHNADITRVGLSLLLETQSVKAQSAINAEIIVQTASVVLKTCQRHIRSVDICRLGLEILLRTVDGNESGESQGKVDAGHSDSFGILLRDHAAKTFFDEGGLRFVFDLFQINHCEERDRLVGSALELLYDLTRDQEGRDRVASANGLYVIQSVIDRFAEHHDDGFLLDAALDCLVNLACSNRPLRGWRSLIPWLIGLIDALQTRHSTTACLEKLIGILSRLAVYQEMGSDISHYGAYCILQTLAYTENNVFLEQALFTLLWQLCFHHADIPVLVTFDAVSITLERLPVHIDAPNEELLLHSLRLLSAIGSYEPCRDALCDDSLAVLLCVIRDSPSYTAKTRQLSKDTLDRINQKEQITRLTENSKLQQVQPSAQAPKEEDDRSPEVVEVKLTKEDRVHRELLLRGAVFRVRRDATQKKRDKMLISLAENGQYLVFRELSSANVQLERIFLSQVEVLPNANDSTQPSSAKTSILLTRKLSKPALVRATSRAQCIFHMMIRKELMSLEASSPDERASWEQALAWAIGQVSMSTKLIRNSKDSHG